MAAALHSREAQKKHMIVERKNTKGDPGKAAFA
jgi:hypothetical protein